MASKKKKPDDDKASAAETIPVPVDEVVEAFTAAPETTADVVSSRIKAGYDSKSQLGALLSSDIIAATLKTYGKKSLIQGSEIKARKVRRIPTGIFPIDYALEGGWAQGGVHTLIGHKSSCKTTVLYATIGEAQKQCAECWLYLDRCICKRPREPVVAYIDVEGALDAAWASRFCDLDKVVISVPEYAEQTLSIGEALLRSGKCDILMIDSIAFLTPAKEIEEAIEKDLMGQQARVLGKGVRKFTAALNAVMSDTGKRPTIFFTNQIRMKIGVMFGCFHANTPVMFADGTQHPIHKVVRERMAGPVLSWDGNRIVERAIVNWFDNGPLPEGEHWLTFRADGTNGQRGAQGFTCTRNHVLVDGAGNEVRAGDVRVGDNLKSWYEASLSLTEHEVLTGTMFGDGHITEKGALRLSNGEQSEYLTWKMNLLPSLGFSRIDSGEKCIFASTSSYEIRAQRDRFYKTGTTRSDKNYRTIPLEDLRQAGPLTLAVWYADDGSYKETHKSASISVKRLTHEHGHAVASVLAERFPDVNYNESHRAIVFPTHSFCAFSKAVARYLPPSMAYKLLPEHRAEATGIILAEPSVRRRETCSVQVKKIHLSKRKHRSLTRYDLQIEGNSFYLVGGDSAGVVVHNSPETAPGGLAPGFMSWTEMKMKTGKFKMDDLGERPLYADFGFSLDKSKSSTAKVGYDFRMMLSDAESKSLGDFYDEDFILDHAERSGLVTGGGTSWKILGETFGKKSEIEKRLVADPIFKRMVTDVLLKSVQQGA